MPEARRRSASSAEAAVKMPPLLLTQDMSTGKAFQQIADACLAHLVLNRALLAEPGVEALHQMRVAVRRLRSACKLFEDALEHRPMAARLQDELRWLGRLLGRVRDWDVLLTQSLHRVASLGAEPEARAAA